jgi:hypothetical protein
VQAQIKLEIYTRVVEVKLKTEEFNTKNVND